MNEWLHTLDAPRAWLGVLTALALYGGKRVWDALFPRGYRFTVIDRWMSQNDDDDEEEER